MSEVSKNTNTPNPSEQTVLITGASSGIGEATAKHLAKCGYNIVLLGRSKERLKKVHSQLPTAGHHLHFSVDFNYSVEISDFCRAFRKERPFKGDFYGLVNNAGTFLFKRCEDHSQEDWQSIFQTNLFAATSLTQGLLPLLKESSSCVVNISSTLGHKPIANTMAYSASKAAMNSWTQALAIEMAPLNIRINSISPGIVNTPLHSFADEEQKRGAGQQHLLGRVGEAHEIAEAVEFILNSKWMTGSDLILDGGIQLK